MHPVNPYMTHPPAPVRRWWQHPALIIVLLVCLPPAGIVLVWFGRWSRKTKVITSVVSLLWFILVLAAPEQETSTTGAAKAAATRAPAQATPTTIPATTPPTTPTTTAPPTTTPPPETTPPVAVRAEDEEWETCETAWAGGVPSSGMERGVDDGYRAGLDANGDGIACSRDIPETFDSSGSAPETTSAPPVDSGDDSSVYYANCTEARAAGAAPLYAGDPGYSRKLDRDGDGAACE